MNRLHLAAATAALALGAVSAQATVYNFTFDDGVDLATGQLVTTGALVTAISGTLDGFAITGLSGWASADNTLVTPNAPYFDYAGLTFTAANGIAYNVYTNGVGYMTNSVTDPGGYGVGALALTIETLTAVPEPFTWALMISGFGLAGAALRWRRAQAASTVRI